jgi:hypothetical protein
MIFPVFNMRNNKLDMERTFGHTIHRHVFDQMVEQANVAEIKELINKKEMKHA